MFKKLTATVLSVSMFAAASPAFADRGGGHWRGGHHGHGGRGHHRDFVVHRVPPGCTSLTFAGLSLLYAAGMFYRYSPQGYVVVSPPVGAIVPTLPPTYTTVIINGAPYYYYGYTYYAPVPGGYVVTAPPAAAPVPQIIAPQPVIQAAPIAAAPVVQQAGPPLAPQPSATPQPALYASDSIREANANRDIYDIYIPNGNGSFTSISLRKTEKGFLGPQGEFYSDHPTIEQLKERYAKR